MDIYEHCPLISFEHFSFELVSLSHCKDLLKCYSDLKAVALFNSDNCGGDDFYYTSYERMSEAIEYWLWEYSRKGFVRLSIIDRLFDEAIGTLEMFKREAEDFFNDTVILRIDLRSDYENYAVIKSVVSAFINNYLQLLECRSVATKAVQLASERIAALCDIGFKRSYEMLVGHDGTEYSDYYIFCDNCYHGK